MEVSHDSNNPTVSAPRAPRTLPSPIVVLAADTTVALGDTILNKPVDDDDAWAMLRALRGRPHRVLTGVALTVSGEIAWSSVVATTVWMRAYRDDEIAAYIRTGTPRDRAGAYGIQDRSFHPVATIDGCYTNVVGLPLCDVQRALTAIDPTRAWGDGWNDPGQCERCALDSTSQLPT